MALSIRWASRAFLTESRLLWISSSGIRRTSLMEWPGWLKCSEIGVGLISWLWLRIERRCSPKRSLSWRLVSPMYCFPHFLHSIRYIKFLDLQLRESVISRSSLVAEKVYLSWPCCRNGQVRQHGCLHFQLINTYSVRYNRNSYLQCLQ